MRIHWVEFYGDAGRLCIRRRCGHAGVADRDGRIEIFAYLVEKVDGDEQLPAGRRWKFIELAVRGRFFPY